MNNTQLVPVFTGEIQGEQRQLCNARDLHTFLEVGRDFSNWVKARIEEYGFLEGEDYSPILANRSDGKAGKPRIDYHLTLATAKELAMVENNDKGREVRRYFIEMEKRARELATGGLPSMRHQLAANSVRLRLLDRLEAERQPAKRVAIHQQLDHASRILGLPTPALDAIGYASAMPTVTEQTATFWDVFCKLKADGNEPLNHARDARLLAISLPQVMRLSARLGLSVPPRSVLTEALRASTNPRFLGMRAINSVILRRTAKCWVFEVTKPENDGVSHLTSPP